VPIPKFANPCLFFRKEIEGQQQARSGALSTSEVSPTDQADPPEGEWMRQLERSVMMSTQSERANPGVRLTLLDREAEIGKRLISGAQAIGIFADVPIADPRRHRIVARDVLGRSARQLIRFVNHVLVTLQERQDIFNSTLHVVQVMSAGDPSRCLFQLGGDELQETGDVGREH
jgi:hypothetical protein